MVGFILLIRSYSTYHRSLTNYKNKESKQYRYTSTVGRVILSTMAEQYYSQFCYHTKDTIHNYNTSQS